MPKFQWDIPDEYEKNPYIQINISDHENIQLGTNGEHNLCEVL